MPKRKPANQPSSRAYWAQQGDLQAMYYQMADKRAIGWSLATIAAYFGYSQTGVHSILLRMQRQGHISGYARVVQHGNKVEYKPTSILNIRKI